MNGWQIAGLGMVAVLGSLWVFSTPAPVRLEGFLNQTGAWRRWRTAMERPPRPAAGRSTSQMNEGAGRLRAWLSGAARALSAGVRS